jgi:hypothetical protein
MHQLTKNLAPTKPISVLAISMAIILAMGVFVASFSWAEKLQVASEFLVPLEMKYSTKIKGMDVELTQRLVKNENGQFAESIVAKGVLGKVTEKGLFHLSQNGHVIPDSFTKKQKTIIGKRFEFQEYDWQAKKLNFSFKEGTGSIGLLSGYQDTMTHKQQLRFDLASGLKDIYYTVIKKGKIEDYHYQVIGNEVLATNIGELNTTILLRKDIIEGKESADIQSKIWLASDWDFVMVKFETYDKDKVTTMKFTQGTLNGQPITPLEKKAEI